MADLDAATSIIDREAEHRCLSREPLNNTDYNNIGNLLAVHAKLLIIGIALLGHSIQK
jgi:hypothetical protein